MENFVRVGKVEEFPARGGRTVVVDGVAVAVFRQGQAFVAVADECPHMKASLAQGELEDGQVVCGWHGWRFDARTGAGTHRSGAAVAVYEARVEGGDLWLRRAADTARETRDPEDEWIAFDPAKHLRRRDERDPGGDSE